MLYGAVLSNGSHQVAMFRFYLAPAALVLLTMACSHPGSGSTPPAALLADSMVLGNFEDDYGSRHTVTSTEWFHRPRARYHIVRWIPAKEYLIARNDPANPSDGGLWTRIDWLRLSGMPPYTWGFCMSAYNAASAEAAESTLVARRETPRTGCNGFPFSRMRRLP